MSDKNKKQMIELARSLIGQKVKSKITNNRPFYVDSVGVFEKDEVFHPEDCSAAVFYEASLKGFCVYVAGETMQVPVLHVQEQQ